MDIKPGKKEPTQEVGGNKVDDLKAREAAISQKEAAIETSMAMLRSFRERHKDFDALETGQGASLSLSEIGKGQSIETVSDKDMLRLFDLEAFMNEPVTIYIHVDGNAGALPVPMPTVNGVNQAIIRGREQVVRRKYVEALARSRITSYEQQVPDSSRPENIQMNPLTSLTYPFTVREDRNPRGRAWLEAIINEPW